MTDKIFLFLTAILPTLALLLFFMYSDKFKEPKKTVLSTFILGIFIIAPLEVFHYGTEMIIGEPIEYNAFFKAFFAASFLEELFKFCVLFFFCTKFTEFNEPMDGIVYGVTVSLGFATYENYDYVFRLAELWEIDPYQLAIWRSYSAVPLHGLNGCIMGFYFGMYSFTANKKYLVLCLLIPFIVHGFYNFLNYPYHFMILGIVTIYTIVLHSNMKKLQESKNKEGEIKKI